jgi:hypothetical protein
MYRVPPRGPFRRLLQLIVNGVDHCAALYSAGLPVIDPGISRTSIRVFSSRGRVRHFAAAVAAIAALAWWGAGGGRTIDELWPWTSADPRQRIIGQTEVAMTVHHSAQPAAQNAMAGPGAAASAPSCSPAPTEQGGWTVRRLRLINDAVGVCARCGMIGADIVTRGWLDDHAVAAHTRCVVGLDPDGAGRDRSA